MLGELSAQYESNGDPACISDGYGDPGGKSYGTYQFSSNAGSLGQFVSWLNDNYPQYGEQLNAYPLCSDSFDEAWRNIAAGDSDGFAQAQHEYVKAAYYDPAVQILADNYWHIENHHDVLKDVVWSRAVQYGVGNILDMWTEAVHSMFNVQTGDYDGYPNLSYIDSPEYPKVLIILVLLFVLIAGAGGWLLCRHYDNLEQSDRDNVHATVRNAQELNRDAQEELDRAREANQSAESANQDAQRAADDLADSTAKLSGLNRSDKDAIDAAERVFSDVERANQ